MGSVEKEYLSHNALLSIYIAEIIKFSIEVIKSSVGVINLNDEFFFLNVEVKNPEFGLFLVKKGGNP